jgi:hypothetical protein
MPGRSFPFRGLNPPLIPDIPSLLADSAGVFIPKTVLAKRKRRL